MTKRHDYDTPTEGATNWHVNLNRNFRKIDSDVEIRDQRSVLSKYDPEKGVKFFATDSGAIFLGTGEQWKRVSSTGSSPVFDTVTVSDQFNNVRIAGSASEIHDCINDLNGSAGSIFIKPGEHLIQKTIKLHEGVKLFGMGKDTALRLRSGTDADLLHLQQGADWCHVQDLHLIGNKKNNQKGSGIHISGDTYGTRFSNLIIDRFPEHGFVTDGSSKSLNFESNLYNVQSKENGETGFTFEYMTDIYASHIYAEKNGEEGIVDYTSHNVYFHPHCYSNKDGMRISQYSSHLDLYCPHFENNRKRGCLLKGDNCVLIGGQSYNNNQSAVEPEIGHDALLIQNGSGNRVLGGSYYDDQSNSTQRWGINEIGTASKNCIHSVWTSGNINAGVQISGTASTHNGVATEQSSTDQPMKDYPIGTFVWFSDNRDTGRTNLYMIGPSGDPIGPLDR